MIVSVFDGLQPLETRECRLVRLPDGRQGAVWRGLAYPLLLPGGRIDAAGEAHAPSACGPDVAPVAGPAFALVEGDEEAYVLLSGSIASCESAAAKLQDAKIEVLRTGRYLGEPVEGLEADWFVRLAHPRDEGEPLRERVGRILGRPSAGGDAPRDLRTRIMADELAAARARQARDHSEIARLRLALADTATSDAQILELRAAIEEERRLRAEAEASVPQPAAEGQSADVTTPVSGAPVPVRAQPSRRVEKEVEDAVASLLPRIRLVRDSLTFVATEFIHRRALYRALRELDEAGNGMPSAWKSVQGVEGWWERHVSNGQDDAGRLYALFDRSNRSWRVLASHKGEQSRDIARLGRLQE